MSIYVGNSEIKNIYVGTTPVKEVYVGTTKVRPSGWTPGSNTIAYFPFKDDTIDKTGNLTLTHGSMTKATVGYNVTGGAKVTTNGAVYYMGGWCNVQTSNDRYINICTGDNPEMGYYFRHAETNLNQVCFVAYNSSFAVSSVSVSIGKNSRHHYAISYENSKTNIYIDGVKKLEYSGIGYNFGNMAYLFCSWYGDNDTPGSGTSTAIISDYILESVGWTADQVASYYNKTKSNYGL